MGKKEQTLASLPGQVFVHTAGLHKRLLASEEERESAAKLLNNACLDDIQELRKIANACAIEAIKLYWDFVQNYPVKEVMTSKTSYQDEPPFKRQTRRFAFCLMVTLDDVRRDFFNSVKARHKAGTMTTADELFTISALSYPKVVPEFGNQTLVVSMHDLVVLFSRFAEVAERTYVRDVGFPITNIELMSLMRHSSVRKLLIAFMTNGRKALMPLIAKLEGAAVPNLDDVNGTFGNEFFEIRELDDAKSLHIKQSVIIDYRAWHEQQLGNTTTVSYGCPLLHTGLFNDMYDWVLQQYEQWLTEELTKQVAE
jgi:hypothetical protein